MYEREEGFSGIGLFLAFLGGAAAGAVTAIMLAPATGEETRAKLRDMALNSKNKVTRVPKALKSAYSQAAEVAKDAFGEAYRQDNLAGRG